MSRRVPTINKEGLLFICNDLEEIGLPPSKQKIELAKAINKSVGYEVIRWNTNLVFWTTSQFFSYYLPAKTGVKFPHHSEEKEHWLSKLQEALK